MSDSFKEWFEKVSKEKAEIKFTPKPRRKRRETVADEQRFTKTFHKFRKNFPRPLHFNRLQKKFRRDSAMAETNHKSCMKEVTNDKNIGNLQEYLVNCIMSNSQQGIDMRSTLLNLEERYDINRKQANTFLKAHGYRIRFNKKTDTLDVLKRGKPMRSTQIGRDGAESLVKQMIEESTLKAETHKFNSCVGNAYEAKLKEFFTDPIATLDSLHRSRLISKKESDDMKSKALRAIDSKTVTRLVALQKLKMELSTNSCQRKAKLKSWGKTKHINPKEIEGIKISWSERIEQIVDDVIADNLCSCVAYNKYAVKTKENLTSMVERHIRDRKAFFDKVGWIYDERNPNRKPRPKEGEFQITLREWQKTLGKGIAGKRGELLRKLRAGQEFRQLMPNIVIRDVVRDGISLSQKSALSLGDFTIRQIVKSIRSEVKKDIAKTIGSNSYRVDVALDAIKAINIDVYKNKTTPIEEFDIDNMSDNHARQMYRALYSSSVTQYRIRDTMNESIINLIDEDATIQTDNIVDEATLDIIREKNAELTYKLNAIRENMESDPEWLRDYMWERELTIDISMKTDIDYAQLMIDAFQFDLDYDEILPQVKQGNIASTTMQEAFTRELGQIGKDLFDEQINQTHLTNTPDLIKVSVGDLINAYIEVDINEGRYVRQAVKATTTDLGKLVRTGRIKTLKQGQYIRRQMARRKDDSIDVETLSNFLMDSTGTTDTRRLQAILNLNKSENEIVTELKRDVEWLVADAVGFELSLEFQDELTQEDIFRINRENYEVMSEVMLKNPSIYRLMREGKYELASQRIGKITKGMGRVFIAAEDVQKWIEIRAEMPEGTTLEMSDLQEIAIDNLDRVVIDPKIIADRGKALAAYDRAYDAQEAYEPSEDPLENKADEIRLEQEIKEAQQLLDDAREEYDQASKIAIKEQRFGNALEKWNTFNSSMYAKQVQMLDPKRRKEVDKILKSSTRFSDKDKEYIATELFGDEATNPLITAFESIQADLLYDENVDDPITTYLQSIFAKQIEPILGTTMPSDFGITMTVEKFATMPTAEFNSIIDEMEKTFVELSDGATFTNYLMHLRKITRAEKIKRDRDLSRSLERGTTTFSEMETATFAEGLQDITTEEVEIEEEEDTRSVEEVLKEDWDYDVGEVEEDVEEEEEFDPEDFT